MLKNKALMDSIDISKIIGSSISKCKTNHTIYHCVNNPKYLTSILENGLETRKELSRFKNSSGELIPSVDFSCIPYIGLYGRLFLVTKSQDLNRPVFYAPWDPDYTFGISPSALGYSSQYFGVPYGKKFCETFRQEQSKKETLSNICYGNDFHVVFGKKEGDKITPSDAFRVGLVGSGKEKDSVANKLKKSGISFRYFDRNCRHLDGSFNHGWETWVKQIGEFEYEDFV